MLAIGNKVPFVNKCRRVSLQKGLDNYRVMG